jgi:hypothetical protein
VLKVNSGLHEGKFKGVTASQEKGDQIRRPIWGNILNFLHEAPSLIDAIKRHIGPYISSGGHFLGFKYPLFQDL